MILGQLPLAYLLGIGLSAMILFPFLGNSRISTFEKDTVRERPLLIRNNGIIEDSFIYNVIQGFADDEISFYKKYSFGNIEVNYEIKKIKGSDTITATRKVHLPETAISLKEYEEFFNFVNECKLSDQMKIEIDLKY